MQRALYVILSYLGALVLFGACAALVVGAGLLPPAKHEQVLGSVVEAPATDLVEGCPVLPGPQADDSAQIPGATPVVASAQGTFDAATLPRDQVNPTQPQAATYTDLSGRLHALTPLSATAANPAPVGLGLHLGEALGGKLTALPTQDRVALAGGVVTQRLAGGQNRGLLAATCTRPAPEAWLVGGDTLPGNTAQLQLYNPGEQAVTASVRVWGATGEIEIPSAQRLAIGPGRLHTLNLEGPAGQEERLVVQVLADGAGVVSTLITQSVQGLVPAGVAAVQAGLNPVTALTIPGVVLGSEGGILRLFNPAKELATAKVRLLGPQGAIDLPGASQIPLDGGAVFDVDLSGIEPGEYGIFVSADLPIVAGAQILRQGSPWPADPAVNVRDYTWQAATGLGGGLLLGPQTLSRRLLISNPNEIAATVKIGAEVVQVDPQSTKAVEVSTLGPTLIEAPTAVVAALAGTNLGDGEGISTLRLVPDATKRQQSYVQLLN